MITTMMITAKIKDLMTTAGTSADVASDNSMALC